MAYPRKRQEEQKQPQREENRPVEVIKVGSIHAAIWENETRYGKSHQVTLTRVYKEGEEWKRTPTLSKNDLPLAEKALSRAFDYMLEAEKQEE